MGHEARGWRTFLRNHAPDMAAIDLCVVPTIGFKLLYGIVIMRLDGDAWCGPTSREPDRGMDRAADHRGIPLGSGTSLSASGSRQVLRCNRQSSIA